jgi:hypothetical protein
MGKRPQNEPAPPQFDDVLKRMLSTPPDPKKKAKPEEKPPEKAAK